MSYQAARFFNQMGFIYISIPKTATNSIWNSILPNTSFRPFQHAKGIHIKKFFTDEQWNSLFKFSCIRNPFDLVRSWYLYHKTHPDLSEEVRDFYSMSFDDWVHKHDFKTHWEKKSHCVLNPLWDGTNPLFQKQWLVDQSGKMLVDELMRFEKLSEGLQILSKNISLYKNLEKLNSSAGSKSIKISSATQNIIYEKFNEDFSFFGFRREL
jgi:hypothetical protein